MNLVYEIIQDSVIASLEGGPWLPETFTVTLPDEDFWVLLKGLVNTKTGQKLPSTTKRTSLQVQGHIVIVRSEKDPEPWLPTTLQETLH